MLYTIVCMYLSVFFLFFEMFLGVEFLRIVNCNYVNYLRIDGRILQSWMDIKYVTESVH